MSRVTKLTLETDAEFPKAVGDEFPRVSGVWRASYKTDSDVVTWCCGRSHWGLSRRQRPVAITTRNNAPQRTDPKAREGVTAWWPFSPS